MRGFITATLFVLGVSEGLAQSAPVQNGQAFGPWRVNCEAVAVGQTACVLSQQILRAEDRAFIAQIMAFQSPDGSKTYLSARVPNGVYFPSGFAVRAQDEDDVLNFVWQSCGRDLCEAVTEIAPEVLSRYSAEDKVMLGAFRPRVNAEDFVFRFFMTETSAGLEALRVTSE